MRGRGEKGEEEREEGGGEEGEGRERRGEETSLLCSFQTFSEIKTAFWGVTSFYIFPESGLAAERCLTSDQYARCFLKAPSVD